MLSPTGPNDHSANIGSGRFNRRILPGTPDLVSIETAPTGSAPMYASDSPPPHSNLFPNCTIRLKSPRYAIDSIVTALLQARGVHGCTRSSA